MSEPANREQLAKFLSILWPAGFGERWCLFWGAPSKASQWTQTITDDFLSTLLLWGARENVYLGCGLRAQNFGPTMRGKSVDVVAIPGLWLDCDYGKDHKKANLPPTEEDAMALIASMGLPPTMILHSGHGLQAWWCFKEPWIFDEEMEHDKAEALTKGWTFTLRARAKANGWDQDSTGDLARVMRVPGLWNRKTIPKPCRLISVQEAHRYNPQDFDAYLLVSATPTKSAPKLDWKGLIKQPDAEPPGAKLLLLCENYSEFKHLCLRIPRPGQKDISPSGFDHHLARLAFLAGWSAQEVTNLLIAQRRAYKCDLKLGHPTYYEDTLSSALSEKDEEERQQLVEELKAGSVMPESIPNDPAKSLAVLSGVLGVRITKLVRFRAGSNSYRMEIDGLEVDVPKIDILDSQTAFRRLILDHTDRRIEPMKAKAWHEAVKRLFEAVQNVQVAGDATRNGAYENWIELHLSEGVSSEADWEKAAVDNRPFERQGHRYFVAEGFRNFLFGRYREVVSSQQLTTELTKFGYQYERINVRNSRGKRSKRSVWRVP